MTTALHEEMVALFVETLRGPNEFDGLSPEAFCDQGANLFPRRQENVVIIRAQPVRPRPT
jgi:hypothetical protein